MTVLVASSRRARSAALLVQRLRGISIAETGWVLGNKTLEVLLTFACLKLMTSFLGPQRFGEYNLVLTVNVLLAAVTIVPVQQSYLRYFHQAKERNEGWETARKVFAWYAVVTIGVVVAAALLSRSVGGLLGIGPWTCVAAGLAFFGDRWRYLGIEVLNIERRRSAWAVQHVTFLVAQVVFLAVALQHWPGSVPAALLAYASASIVLAAVSVASMRTLREPHARHSAAGGSGLSGMVLSFGIPCGLLVLLQWVQAFSDRYLLGALLDLDAVGVYVAAYQLFGVPFTLGSGIVHTFVVPVAYARAKDGQDAAAVRRADSVLIRGVAIYLTIGLAAVVGLGYLGQPLLAWLTDARFAVSGSVVLLLAVGRYLEGLSVLLQVFYEVRNRMRRLFRIRLVAAVAMVILCFLMIRTSGIAGAALGNLLAFAGYVVLMLSGMRRGARGFGGVSVPPSAAAVHGQEKFVAMPAVEPQVGALCPRG